MTDGFFPALVFFVSVVQKVFRDIVANAIQCDALLQGRLDGHGYQRYVRVGRLDALHLLVTIVRVELVWLDGASWNHGDGLGGAFAHVERLLQFQDANETWQRVRAKVKVVCYRNSQIKTDTHRALEHF